jgi:hypothetical protein
MWIAGGLIAGTAAVFVLVAWLLRRRERDSEDVGNQEYRDPPVVGWPDYM